MKRKMTVMVIVIRPPSFGLTSIVVVVALSAEIFEAHPKIHRDHRVPCLTLVKPTPREGAI